MSTFTLSSEGSRGTAVFGNGVDAITGEVVATGDDYIIVEGRSAARASALQSYLIPTASIVYWRYASEDD